MNKCYQIRLKVGEPEGFSVTMYASSLKVPHERMDDMSRILNHINSKLPCGLLNLDEFPNTHIVRYRLSIDGRGNSFNAACIDNILNTAKRVFSDCRQLLDTIPESNISADEAWSSFVGTEREKLCRH